jgi:single-strand DNA-binding protein
MAEPSLNRVELLGRLGGDPKINYMQDGQAQSTLSIATNQIWKDKEGNEAVKTDWHRVVAWGKLAEVCRDYLKKGSKVHIEGSLHTREYSDKDGQKKFITEVKLKNLLMLGSPEKTSIDNALKEYFDAVPVEDDGLPF